MIYGEINKDIYELNGGVHMSDNKYAATSTDDGSSKTTDNSTTIADQAARKAEAEVEKIKQEAHEQLTSGKVKFNNPDDE